MRVNKVIVVYARPTSKEQRDTLKIVLTTLKKHKIAHAVASRNALNSNLFEKRDLAIAVGGDGTFLKTSHFIFEDTLIFGVNSDPHLKEGFFMNATKKDFGEKLKRILKEDNKIINLNRLEACIGKRKVPELALNEFYISSKKEYRTARYCLTVNGKTERQKSSGIIVSTAAGSYAWMKSAGGKVLPLESDKFEYLVREPYCGKISAKCSLANGILNRDEKIEVEFESGRGILIADSLGKEHIFDSGEKVTIKMSSNPLRAIEF